jgi:hypothetical protein
VVESSSFNSQSKESNNPVAKPDPFYHLIVAGVVARSLAQFLGLKLSASGTLATEKQYFAHEDSEKSYEVKIIDVIDRKLFGPEDFTRAESAILEKGFDTINREIAHLTYWAQPGRHHDHSGAISGDDYYQSLKDRVLEFAGIVLTKTEDIINRNSSDT